MSANRGDAAVGMMDSAYFTGRRELLEFFNDLLAVNLSKIEQTASGAVACQLTEYIFPGSIPMSKVNWDAKSDYEFVHNYKLLQAAFTKNRIQRHIDVNKLIRAKYQDNLEFCQWLKAFFEQSGVYRPEYDPIAVRGKGKGGKKWNSKKPSSGAGARARGANKAKTATTTNNNYSRPLTERGRNTNHTTNKNNHAPPISDNGNNNNSMKTASNDRNKNDADNNMTSSATASEESPTSTSPTPAQEAAAAAAAEAAVLADAALMKKNADLTTKVTELELAVVEIEKERDFYFEKLRNVEVMLQVHQEKMDSMKATAAEGDGDGTDDAAAANVEFEALVDKVFKVLYATAEDAITVSDDGDIVVGTEIVDTTFEDAMQDHTLEDDLEDF